MIASRIIRNAATTIRINTISYEDLTNAMGETRLLLARLTIERDLRLNLKAHEDAQIVHDDEQQERDEFAKHVRETVENKH